MPELENGDRQHPAQICPTIWTVRSRLPWPSRALCPQSNRLWFVPKHQLGM